MSSSTGKRKEIYKYLAPWPLYSMNWSVRPDKRFRLALGSFIEEYNNKVQIISLDEETSEFSAKRFVCFGCTHILQFFAFSTDLIKFTAHSTTHIQRQKLCGFPTQKEFFQICLLQVVSKHFVSTFSFAFLNKIRPVR